MSNANGNLGFLKSSQIEVFPSSHRGKEYSFKAKTFLEDNITGLRSNLDYWYVEGHSLIVCLAGYKFKITHPNPPSGDDAVDEMYKYLYCVATGIDFNEDDIDILYDSLYISICCIADEDSLQKRLCAVTNYESISINDSIYAKSVLDTSDTLDEDSLFLGLKISVDKPDFSECSSYIKIEPDVATISSPSGIFSNAVYKQKDLSRFSIESSIGSGFYIDLKEQVLEFHDEGAIWQSSKLALKGGELQVGLSESGNGNSLNSVLYLSDVSLDGTQNFRLSAGLSGNFGADEDNTSVQILYPAINDDHIYSLCLPRNLNDGWMRTSHYNNYNINTDDIAGMDPTTLLPTVPPSVAVNMGDCARYNDNAGALTLLNGSDESPETFDPKKCYTIAKNTISSENRLHRLNHGVQLWGKHVSSKACDNTEYNVKNNWYSLVDLIYPIGSIYMTMGSTPPDMLFGGVWKELRSRFLIGAGWVDDVDINNPAGSVGGSARLPAHYHDIILSRPQDNSVAEQIIAKKSAPNVLLRVNNRDYAVINNDGDVYDSVQKYKFDGFTIERGPQSDDVKITALDNNLNYGMPYRKLNYESGSSSPLVNTSSSDKDDSIKVGKLITNPNCYSPDGETLLNSKISSDESGIDEKTILPPYIAVHMWQRVM